MRSPLPIENGTHPALAELEQDVLWIEKDLSISFATRMLLKLHGDGAAFPEALNLPKSSATALRAGISQCFENMLPVDMCLSMLPDEIVLEDGRVLALKVKPHLDATGNPERLSVLFSDHTEIAAKQKKCLEELETLRTLVGLIGQRPMLEVFLQEVTRLLRQLKEASSLEEGKRLLHTLKGNIASVGLKATAAKVHALESRFVQAGGDATLAREYAAEVSALLHEFLADHQALLQITVEIDTDGLLSAALTAPAISTPGTGEAPTRSDEATAPLAVLARQFSGTVKKVAERLNKQIHFRSAGTTLPVNEPLVLPIASELIHIVRNCCDHGIERPLDRITAGKFPEGTISLRVDVRGNSDLVLTLQDDGAGIKTEKLVAKAVSSGLLSEAQAKALTPRQAMELIFADGFSTAEKVTSLSGRGVGLAALKERVQETGGSLDVDSTPGEGCRFTIVIPGGYAPHLAKDRVFIPWAESFSVQVDIIDSQHQHLVDLVNRAAKSGGHLGELNEILEKLVRYTVEHFATEERLMQESAYPALDDHSREHRELLESVGGFVAKLDRDDFVGLSESLLNFLKEWLLSHIASSDKAFGRFLATQGKNG